MPADLPVSEAGPEILHRDATTCSLGRVIMRRLEDPDVVAVYLDAQAQRIRTIERAKHSAR